jgi:hypothetical protein
LPIAFANHQERLLNFDQSLNKNFYNDLKAMYENMSEIDAHGKDPKRLELFNKSAAYHQNANYLLENSAREMSGDKTKNPFSIYNNSQLKSKKENMLNKPEPAESSKPTEQKLNTPLDYVLSNLAAIANGAFMQQQTSPSKQSLLESERSQMGKTSASLVSSSSASTSPSRSPSFINETVSKFNQDNSDESSAKAKSYDYLRKKALEYELNGNENI